MRAYKNKKVTIMGLGLQGSGVAAAKFFAKQGAKVTVTDIKTKDRLQSSIDQLKKFKNIQYILGQHRPEDFSRADLVVKGPGVGWDSKYLALAQKNEVSVETEAGIFFKLVENPVVGITGTRGKSTTTRLIYEVFKAGGKEVLTGGNVNNKPLLSLVERVKKKTGWLVVELSSFQLEGDWDGRKSPQIAVVLNLMADHLNRYKNLEDYHETKLNLVKNQGADDWAVLNYQDEKLRELASTLKSKVWFFSKEKIGGTNVVFKNDGKIMFREGSNEEQELMPASQVRLIGRHRVDAILAAVAVGLIVGIPPEKIREAVSNFSGIEHRLEVVRDEGGVLYVNDTTATTPEAARMALASFQDPIVLIAGGSDKGLDYEMLAKDIIAKAKGLILLPGKGTDRLVKEIRRNVPSELGEYDFSRAENMEEAVKMAKEAASAGDVVLLSPGCASFGLFENEFERGDVFKEAVNSL